MELNKPTTYFVYTFWSFTKSKWAVVKYNPKIWNYFYAKLPLDPILQG